MTELVAGLLVASMLMVGLAEITRRYTQTTLRAKNLAADIRSTYILAGLMRQLERADAGSVTVAPDRIKAKIGSADLEAHLSPGATHTRLEWSSPLVSRTVVLPKNVHFEQTSFGALVLQPTQGPPLAIVRPARAIPFDCQFDTVTRECR